MEEADWVDEADDWDDDWDDEADDWDDDWDPSARYVRVSRRGSGLRHAVVFFAVLFLFAAIGLWWVMRWVGGEVDPSGAEGVEVEFTVEEGWSTNRIAEELASEGVIGNSTIFRYWLRCDGVFKFALGCDETVDESFQAGDYVLAENMAYDDILAALQAGPVPPEFLDVNVPEGMTLVQLTGKLVDENPQYSIDDIEAALSTGAISTSFAPPEYFGVPLLEGLLFPATYQIDEEHLTDEADLLQRMSDTMTERFATAESAAGRDPVIDELGLTDYEIVIVASLIEEEAKIDDDRARISRVIYNRLVAGEPLGIDATARYAEFDPADAEFDSPFNTRLYAGLPPTPIAAPGQASLEAALAPEPGSWFYYVLTNEGGVEGAHFFTDDYNAFLEAKERCAAAGLGCG